MKRNSSPGPARETQSSGYLPRRGRRIFSQCGFQDLSLSGYLGFPSLSDLLADGPAKIWELQPDPTCICVSMLSGNVGNRYRSHKELS
jgi:hypothetical protein